MRVGYVGLGAMGKELASRLPGAHDLLVWDLNPESMQALVERGARAALSLSDLGSQSEIVVLCLPKSANVEAVLFGEPGLATAMAPGTIVVDQTSGQPGKTRDFAKRLAQLGIGLIDAPVSGGVPAAIAGHITIITSGEKDVYKRALPVLQSISNKVFRCSGKVGDGQVVKAINNMINSANRVMTLEIVAVGRWLGLETAAMTEALNRESSRSFITEKFLPAIVEQRASTDFSLALMVKDLNQAADLGFVNDAPMPVSETARGLINVALSVLGEEARLEDIVTFMERLMKTKFSAGLNAEPLIEPERLADALQLVVSAIAAGNRLVMIENTALALKAGLDVTSFAQVILSGSAASAEAELLFAFIEKQAKPDNRSLGSLVDDLSRIARIGASHAVPMLMTNQVRAQCLRCANKIGRDRSIDEMFQYFVEPHSHEKP